MSEDLLYECLMLPDVTFPGLPDRDVETQDACADASTEEPFDTHLNTVSPELLSLLTEAAERYTEQPDEDAEGEVLRLLAKAREAAK